MLIGLVRQDYVSCALQLVHAVPAQRAQYTNGTGMSQLVARLVRQVTRKKHEIYFQMNLIQVNGRLQ